MASPHCGVYVIEHTATGRRYVGSAVSLSKRWKEHRRQLMQGRPRECVTARWLNG